MIYAIGCYKGNVGRIDSNDSDVSNPAKMRCQMHMHYTGEQVNNDKKIKQEWNNGRVSIMFDNNSEFQLKKIKLDTRTGEDVYTL